MFVGIDPSYGGLAIVVRDNDRTHDWVRSFPLSKFPSGTHRLAAVEKAVFEHIHLNEWGDQISAICMEGYSRGSSMRREEAGEVSAATRIGVYNSLEKDVPIIFVAPQMLKKFATGSGKADKKQVIAAVKENWGIEYANDNLADAFVLSVISEMLFLERDSPLVYQQEVLDRLRG